MADDMPEEAAAGPSKSRGAGTFGFLAHKWGPLPAGVWIGGLGVLVLVGLKAKGLLTGGSSTAGTIDPASGQTYQAEAYDVASGATYASEYNTLKNAGSSGTGPSTSQTQTFSTNSDWSNAAVNFLVSIGYSGTAATAAIQQYLTGQVPTAAQQQMVDAAIKYLGSPPQQPTPSGGTAPPPPPPPGPPPPPSSGLHAPVGFKTTDQPGTGSIDLSWGAVPGATGYVVAWSGGGGKGSERYTTTHGRLTLPKQGTRYTATVEATATGKTSPKSNSVSFTTKRDNPRAKLPKPKKR